MNTSTTNEINDVFDAIAFSENSIVQSAFNEGLKKGDSEAKEEGYHLGFHKGIEFGAEIGYYEGTVNTLLQLHKEKQITFSDKIILILLKLKTLLETFPSINCPNTDILHLRRDIKSHFQRLCSLLKFDGNVSETGLSF